MARLIQQINNLKIKKYGSNDPYKGFLVENPSGTVIARTTSLEEARGYAFINRDYVSKKNSKVPSKEVKLSPKEKAREMVEDPNVTFDELYTFMNSKEIGFWDGINSEDVIKQYVNKMQMEGVRVSHILEAIENNPSIHELYEIWLGDSMETPKPINNKRQLYNALVN